MSIRATPQQLRRLAEIIQRRNADAVVHVDAIASGGLLAEGRELLLDLLSAELIERGLDPTDEPNGLGLEVEELIDLVSAT